jgi:hypothetical protein
LVCHRNFCAVRLYVKENPNKEPTRIIALRTKNIPPETLADILELRRLLHLNQDATELELTSAPLPSRYWRITQRGKAFQAQVVNYADDFVILSCRHAAEALDWTRKVMTRLGLTLNEAKTKLRDARRESFDFLGYTFGPQHYRKDGHWYLGASPVEEERGATAAEGERRVDPQQYGDLAGSARPTEQHSARLVELLQLRHPAAGVSRGR